MADPLFVVVIAGLFGALYALTVYLDSRFPNETEVSQRLESDGFEPGNPNDPEYIEHGRTKDE